MKTKFLIPLVLVAACALPSSALAGTVTFDGETFTYTAGQGESNSLLVDVTDDCAGLDAPCFSFMDSWSTLAPPAGCTSTFSGIRCPIPGTVRLSTGDGTDIISDWNGPSTIYAGSGADLVQAHDGDDALYGDAGVDTLIGGMGDDFESGGQGNDTLDSYPGGISIDDRIMESDSFGSDILIGGPGEDTASYGIRTDALTLSLDGEANDGADGEGDGIASDVESVEGAEGDDTIMGNGGANVLIGKQGDDVVAGGGGDDTLDGGQGADFLSGNTGSDTVSGGGQDDLLVGGSGKDWIYGEYVRGCSGWAPCIAGQDDIRAQDGEEDLVGCGFGTDTVELDRIDKLWENDCERGTVAGGQQGGKGDKGNKGGTKGKGAAGCRRFKGEQRTICRRAAKLMRQCEAVNGTANHQRCRRSIMRMGKKECRKMLRGRYARRCVRIVRQILKATQ
jgi:RTX calcium-binding nonapeptide repeat (4 copies)